MGLLDTVGQLAGGVLGNSILPGIGGAIGSELGGVAGNLAGGLLGQIFDQFQKDPIGTMADPMSLPSKLVDGVLGQFGAPKEFRSLVGFAMDPMSAIKNILSGQDQCNVRPTAPGGGQCSGDQGLSTNGKDCVDTGRYVISAQEGEVKCYDKQTNTWVDCKGDPHLSTSDGDKAQFQKNLTIDLPDGTELKIKTTPQDKNGVSYIDKVAVLKGDEAVVMTGFHDGKQGVNVGHVLNNADSVAGQWSDGTVLRAGKNVSDLTFASDGKEIVGGDPNGRWGEWNLDGHGGVGRADPKGNGGGVGLQDLQQLIQQLMNILRGGAGGVGGAVGGAVGGGVGGAVGGGQGFGDGSSNTIFPGGGSGGVGGVGGTTGGGGGGIGGLTNSLNGISDQMGSLQQQIANLDPNSPTYQKDLMNLQFKLQQTTQAFSEISTMITNVLKTLGDAVQTVSRNLAQ